MRHHRRVAIAAAAGTIIVLAFAIALVSRPVAEWLDMRTAEGGDPERRRAAIESLLERRQGNAVDLLRFLAREIGSNHRLLVLGHDLATVTVVGRDFRDVLPELERIGLGEVELFETSRETTYTFPVERDARRDGELDLDLVLELVVEVKVPSPRVQSVQEVVAASYGLRAAPARPLTECTAAPGSIFDATLRFASSSGRRGLVRGLLVTYGDVRYRGVGPRFEATLELVDYLALPLAAEWLYLDGPAHAELGADDLVTEVALRGMSSMENAHGTGIYRADGRTRSPVREWVRRGTEAIIWAHTAADLDRLPDDARAIHLEGNALQANECARLARFALAKTLDAGGCSLIDDAAMRVIGGLSRLERLAIGTDGITSAGLVELARLPRLRELALHDHHDAGLRAADLAPLADLAGLESLEIHLRRLTADSLRHVSELPRLRRLVVPFFSGGDDPLEFAEVLRRVAEIETLDELMIGNLPSRAAGAFERLTKLSRLRSLVLFATDVDDAALAHLGRIATLEYLEVYDSRSPFNAAGLDALRGLERLRLLHVSPAEVDLAALVRLAETLPGEFIVYAPGSSSRTSARR